jgi:hypothetical protein
VAGKPKTGPDPAKARSDPAKPRSVATRPVFPIRDVEVGDLFVGDGADLEVGDLFVGDGADLTVEDVLALPQLAASGAWGLAGGALEVYSSNVGIFHFHGLRPPGDLVGEPYLPARRL